MRFNLFTSKSKSTKEDNYVVVYKSRTFAPVDAEENYTDEALSDVILDSRFISRAPFSGCAGLYYDGDTVYVKLSTDRVVDFLPYLRSRFPLETIDSAGENVFAINKPENATLDTAMLKSLPYRYCYFIEGLD